MFTSASSVENIVSVRCLLETTELHSLWVTESVVWKFGKPILRWQDREQKQKQQSRTGPMRTLCHQCWALLIAAYPLTHLKKEIGCHFSHHLFLLPRDMCKEHGGRADFFLANIQSLEQIHLIETAKDTLPRCKRGCEYKNLPLLDCWVRGRLNLPPRILKWKVIQI